MDVDIILDFRSSILLVIISNLCSKSVLFLEMTVSLAAWVSKFTLFYDFSLIIYCLSLLISYLYCSRLVERDSSLTRAFTLTILARLAKFNVESVSWKHCYDVDIVATMNVFEFPPKESLKRHVSFESR